MKERDEFDKAWASWITEDKTPEELAGEQRIAWFWWQVRSVVADRKRADMSFIHPVQRSNHQDIQDFARTFDVLPVWKDGLQIDPAVLELRAELIKEEVARELFPALQRFATAQSLENLTEVADALVDSVYVLLGCAVAMELPWDALWKEVHDSNMRKVHKDGTVHRREDGKILKPEGWKPPDLFKIIMQWYTEKCIHANSELSKQYRISDINTGQEPGQEFS
jgi:hypothetical protein